METACRFPGSHAERITVDRYRSRTHFLLLAASFLSSIADAADVERASLRASGERMEARIVELSRYGANPEGGVSRVAFSDADVEARKYVQDLMRDAGLAVRVDAAGNIIGRREGAEPGRVPIMFGSHIDSVPGGGNYDGNVGVIGALEVVEVLKENGVTTRHPLEVVSFTDEEGGLTGSRAMTVGLSKAALDVVTHSGLTVREGMRRVGGDPDRLGEPLLQRGELHAFVELHIEQGAFLHENDIEIGIVEGIVGIRWWDVVVDGVANHAGTTPMNRRNDAMVAAAEMVLAVNDVANTMEGRQVATVGRIRADPGAPNVIPGRVIMSLEIRDLSSDKIERVFDAIADEINAIADRRGSSVDFREIDVASPPAPTDERIRDVIDNVATTLGLTSVRMPSGAGHDAQDMTNIAPTGMIFVPSVGGVSHSPREYTSAGDMAKGATVLLHTVLALDEQSRIPVH